MARKKSRRSNRKNREPGTPDRFPLATIAFYGPDNQHATKVAVGIITKENSEPEFLERWYSEDSDVRIDPGIQEKIAEFLKLHQPARVAMTQTIIGCPHQEGIDYPEGQICPKCPFWEGRDRWTGLMVN